MIQVKRGYKPAVKCSPEMSNFAQNLAAHRDIGRDLLDSIELIQPRFVTQVELIRDWGFSRSGIRLLKKLRWITPVKINGSDRQYFALHEVIRLNIEIPGLVDAPTMRTTRKSGNIIGVLRDAICKLISRGRD